MIEKKINLCLEQDLNPCLPAILVGRDIHYDIRSPHWICGNFIDVSSSNAVKPRDIFFLRHLCVSWLNDLSHESFRNNGRKM